MVTGDLGLVMTQHKARVYRDDEFLDHGRTKRSRGQILGPVPLSAASGVHDTDEGCCCENTGCPWHWQGSPRASTPSCSEPSFFRGPLLWVKEYRNPRTREIRQVGKGAGQGYTAVVTHCCSLFKVTWGFFRRHHLSFAFRLEVEQDPLVLDLPQDPRGPPSYFMSVRASADGVMFPA